MWAFPCLGPPVLPFLSKFLILRPHAFKVFPQKHAGCYLHATSFLEFLSFYFIFVILRPHPFQVFPQKHAGRGWSCIEIDVRWLYRRSPSIHMRRPFIIGRDSWVMGYIFVLASHFPPTKWGNDPVQLWSLPAWYHLTSNKIIVVVVVVAWFWGLEHCKHQR